MTWDLVCLVIVLGGVAFPGAMTIRSSRSFGCAVEFALFAGVGAVALALLGEMPISAWAYVIVAVALLAYGAYVSRTGEVK